MIFKNAVFGHETCNLHTEVTCGPSFYPRGLELSLFTLYGQLFKIAIFGQETWNLKKKVLEKLHLDPVSTPGGSKPGVEIELIFSPRAAVYEIGQFIYN